jgi:hypothetical protein
MLTVVQCVALVLFVAGTICCIVDDVVNRWRR